MKGKSFDKFFERTTRSKRKYFKPTSTSEAEIPDSEDLSDESSGEPIAQVIRGRSGRNRAAQNKGKSIANEHDSEFDAEDSDNDNTETDDASDRDNASVSRKRGVQRKGKTVVLDYDSDFVNEDSDNEIKTPRELKHGSKSKTKKTRLLQKSKRHLHIEENDNQGDDDATGRGMTSCAGTKRQKTRRTSDVPVKKAKRKRCEEGRRAAPLSDFSRGTDFEDHVSTDELAGTDDNENLDRTRNKKHCHVARQNPEKQKKFRGAGRFKGLEFRGSPRTLSEIIRSLSSQQRAAVEEIGLGSILALELDCVPSKLGYFVINSYSPAHKNFKILGGKFTIRANDVHNVFGLQMGGRSVGNREKSHSANALVKEWKSQFYGTKDSQITTKKLSEKIKELNGEAGNWFKLNFLVLFYTSLVKCHKNAYTNSQILHSINNVDEIKDLNWCDLIVRVLGESVTEWVKLYKNTNFTGPLVFLAALYMDRVKVRNVRYERQWPVIKGLTSEMMKARQKSEITQGEFGLGAILERNNPISAQGYKRVNEVPELAEQEGRETVGDDVFNMDTASETDILVMLRQLAAKMEASKKEYDSCYAKAVNMVSIQKEVSDTHAALKISVRFVDDFETPPPTRSTRLSDEVNNQSDALDFADDVIEDVIQQAMKDANHICLSAFDVHQPNQLMEDTPFVSSCGEMPRVPQSFSIDPRINVSTHGIPTSAEVIPASAAPIITPINVPEFRHNNVHPENPPSNSSILAIQATSPSTVQVNPVTTLVPYNPVNQRAKRVKYPGRAVSSPFDGTKTDLERSIDPADERLIGYISDNNHNANPCLFLWEHYTGSLVDFNSLANGKLLTHELVTAWCIFQNNLEQTKMPGQLHRLFATLYCTMYKVDDSVLKEPERSESFIDCMNELMEVVSFIDIKAVRLTFFPILYHDHYFLVVFDMHNNSIDVLDNCGFKMDFLKKYGHTIENLRHSYHLYLRSIGHEKAGLLPNMQINRVPVPWSTSEKDVNCGLFMMRHMESYYGGGIRCWNTGLSTSASQRKKQLEKLRKLYVVDMLKWTLNERRIEVNKKTALYVQTQVAKEKKRQGRNQK